MAAYAVDSKGREFVAIATIEQYSGDIVDFESYDVTHALSGRQKNSGQAGKLQPQGIYPFKTTEISIESFLQIVNSTYQSILSKDVLDHFGKERKKNGEYYWKVKFSERNRSTDVFGKIEQLEQDLAETRKKAANLQSMIDRRNKKITALSRQLEQTFPGMKDRGSIDDYAKRFISDTNSEIKVKDISKMLYDLYDLMAKRENGRNVSEREIRTAAMDAAKLAVYNGWIEDHPSSYYGAAKEAVQEKKNNKQLPLAKYGNSGDAVRTVQAFLNVLDNAKFIVDGSFGSKTKAAVEHWQKNNCDAAGNNLDPDGEVGPLTWGSFFVRV